MLAYEDRQSLCAQLEEARPALVDAVLADFYPHPFWDDRYGERGRHFARQDNNYHLDYLLAAIRVDSPPTLAGYYTWLRSVLVSRGMCSYHIRQNIELMQRHLQRLLPAVWPAIAPYEQAGFDGLAYDDPACRELAEHEARLASALAPQLNVAALWQSQARPASRDLAGDAARFYLSYLQDALGSGQAETLAGYLGWLAGYVERSGGDPAQVEADLRLMLETLTTELSAATSQRLRDLAPETQ